jgi:hypothetical protein
LQILDEGQFEDGAVVRFPQDDWNFLQAEKLRGSPAPFAGDQFEMALAFSDNQWLNNALFLDRVSQLTQGLRGKVLAGLEGAGANAIERNALHVLASIRRRRGIRA